MINEMTAALFCVGFAGGGFLAGYAKSWFKSREEICTLRKDLNLCSNSHYVDDLRERTKKAESKADYYEKANRQLTDKISAQTWQLEAAQKVVDKFQSDGKDTFENLTRKSRAVNHVAKTTPFYGKGVEEPEEIDETEEAYATTNGRQTEKEVEKELFRVERQPVDSGKKFASADGISKPQKEDDALCWWILGYTKPEEIADQLSHSYGSEITVSYARNLLSRAKDRWNASHVNKENGDCYCLCCWVESEENGDRRLIPWEMVNDFGRWKFDDSYIRDSKAQLVAKEFPKPRAKSKERYSYTENIA